MNKFIFILVAGLLAFGCAQRTQWRPRYGGYGGMQGPGGYQQPGYGRAQLGYGQMPGTPYGAQGYGRAQLGYGRSGGYGPGPMMPYGGMPGGSYMPAYYTSQYTGTAYDPRTAPAVAQNYFMREAIRNGQPIAPQGANPQPAPSPQPSPSALSSASSSDEDMAALRDQVMAHQRQIQEMSEQLQERGGGESSDSSSGGHDDPI